MSQDFLDAELVNDFIIESREHLETIEPNLLELEKSPENLVLLNDIFRPMHSLKGASGFLGLNRINKLAHRAENILDELRKGTMTVDSIIMDVILSATDAFNQMLISLENTNSEGDTPTEHIIDLMDRIMAGEQISAQEADAQLTASNETDGDFSSEAFSSVEEVAVHVPVNQSAPQEVQEITTEENADLSFVEASENIMPQEMLAQESVIQESLEQITEESVQSPKEGLGLTTLEWIDSLPVITNFPLTAFGAAHLRDFIDEALENTENLNTGLFNLEKEPEDYDEINDLFRFFHNLKGNSGLIGYQALNSLTHEAETLLNRARQHELAVTSKLIDLLLVVVDAMEVLIKQIDIEAGVAHPFDSSELLQQLQAVVSGEDPDLPPSLRTTHTHHAPMSEQSEPVVETVDSIEHVAELDTAIVETASEAMTEPVQAYDLNNLVIDDNEDMAENIEQMPEEEEVAFVPKAAPAIVPIGSAGQDQDDDLEMFLLTIRQQEAVIQNDLRILADDSTQKNHQDSLYRCFIAMQNSSNFMGFAELKEYAQRTAAIVDKARSSDDIDFECILSLLDQETEIMVDMAVALVDEAKSGGAPVAPEASLVPEAPTPLAQAPAPVAQAPAPLAQTPEPPQAPAPAPVAQAPAPAPVAPAPVAQASAPVAPAPTPVAPALAPAPVAETSVKISTPVQEPAPKATPSPQASSAPSTSAKPKTADTKSNEQKPASSIRVDYEKLDHLMNLIGELLINRNRYAMIAKNLEAGANEVDVLAVSQDLTETTYAMSRVSDDLQDTLMKVRMLPVSSVFSRFPRLVRDISRKCNKEIELILEGEETELDKSIVESINDPLMHLIRNSLDHGIEEPDVRIAAGKNPVGRVTLRAYHKGNSVVIEIEDDGKGIDPEKMRQVAVSKGIISLEDANALSDKEATELIFAPGFSSAEVITDISGRGVGMDVVRTNIKNLKGNISIHTVPGQGTRFTLSLPLTLAIIEALMIKMGKQMYAIPLDAVATTTKLESALLTSINGRNAVTLRGEVLGIVDLGELLDLPTTLHNEVISIVILQDNDRRIGLVVNQLLDRQEIVIKPLGAYLNNIMGLSGASIMGDGSVVLILDPHEIYTMATPKPNAIVQQQQIAV